MFKKLLMAAAFTGLAATATADDKLPVMSQNGFGDLALVPYYTVREGYTTGVHLINSSDQTQVVKVRLRRGADSMDALDFNVILSPQDWWGGWISDTPEGTIRFNSGDTSCTVPQKKEGRYFEMPNVFRDGAEEGYIEIIGMGSIDVDSPIGRASKHVDGVPRDCNAVETNFFSIGADYPQTAGVLPVRGVQNKGVSHQTVDATLAAAEGYVCNGDVCVNEFQDTENILKVSYFIRDTESGVEFGGEAVHIQDFLNEPAMTNQQLGLLSDDLSGFDYPDLNGGAVDGTRGRFDLLRRPEALGAFSIVNDWSVNPNNGVSTDWVVTMPGQYAMLNKAGYFADLDSADEDDDCVRFDECDNRDLPVVVDFDIYDREEGVFTPEPADLVVSPAPPPENPEFTLKREVNVIQFNASQSVLASPDATVVDNTLNPLNSNFGFVDLSVTGATGGQICDIVPGAGNLAPLTAASFQCAQPKFQNVPVIGFVAWKRNYVANPDANYGRIVEHSYITSTK